MVEVGEDEGCAAGFGGGMEEDRGGEGEGDSFGLEGITRQTGLRFDKGQNEKPEKRESAGKRENVDKGIGKREGR